MASREMVRNSYDSARNEILMRMKMRDQLLLAYLVIVATILGLWVQSGNVNGEILLIIPFISLGVSMMEYHHNEVMAQLGQFCAGELEDFMNKFEPTEYAPHWDNSETYKLFSDTSTKQRTVISSLILCTPSPVALWVNKVHGISSGFPFGQLWWLDVVISLLVLYVIFKSYSSRRGTFRERWPQK